MTAADVPLGMRLKTQANWNQCEADWRRFLDMQPDGCFVAELDGVPVGTTTTCLFGPVAWIAMVLVDASMRGRGVGTALMRHALAFLDQCAVTTIRLDATPLGQPLYERLGFRVDYRLARYEGIPGNDEAPFAGPVRAAQPEDMDDLCQFDQTVSGTDRRKFLKRLYDEQPEEVRILREGGRLRGYVIARAGARAWQLGPCLADEDGAMLLDDVWCRHEGQRIYLDVPADHIAATRWARERKLQMQRPLVRMSRGPRVREGLARLWTSSGPELG